MDLAFIPSPEQSEWVLFGVVPIRAYALCLIAGIVAACWITEVRLRNRGAAKWTVLDLAIWGVPFGIVGARIYHVITSPDNYFGADGEPLQALQIWEGGLGVPGAVAGGALGVWFACRQVGVPFSMVADSLAPGLPVAQAIGRLGNWFNQELFGRPTDLPWGLEITRAPRDLQEIPAEYLGAAAYHPTFLYEALWNLGVAGLIWRLDKKFKFGAGRAFAVYVLLYGVGRFWIEGVRIDPAHMFMGLRVNEWVALAMIVGAIIYLLRVSGRQTVLVPDAAGKLHQVEWDSTPARKGEYDPDAAEGADPDEADPDEADPDEADSEGNESDDADSEDEPGKSVPTSHDDDPQARS